MKWQFALIYLADIVVCSMTAVEHISHVQHVLTLLNDAKATLTVRKRKFYTNNVDYSGQAIRPWQLRAAPHISNAVCELKASSPFTKLQSLHGLCHVIHSFSPHFAQITVSLNKRLQRKQPATFGPFNTEKLAALKALKSALVTPPALAYPSSSRHDQLKIGHAL